MKSTFRLAALALLITTTALSLASCGSDDDDNNGGSSKFKDQTFTVGGVKFKMIAVEGGEFMMGAPDTDKEAFAKEKPQHLVEVGDFYIGETEVTQALWKAVMTHNPSYHPGDDLPVETIRLNDCKDFVEKLSQMTKKKFRLLTEEEWEFAARGGKKSKGFLYSGSDNIDEVAWYSGNCTDDNYIHPVATTKPNELGIYDMSGNVREYVSSNFTENYSENAKVYPNQFVWRGGSAGSPSWACRVSFRDWGTTVTRDGSTGFRLAMEK